MKTTKTTPKTTPTTTKTPYTNDILTNFEYAVRMAYTHTPTPDHIANDPDVINTMNILAKWAVYAVLKKLRNVGGEIKSNDPYIKRNAKFNAIPKTLTRELTADINNTDRLNYIVKNDYAMRYTNEGDIEILYNELHTDGKKLEGETLSDASDLLQTALLTVWTETKSIITDHPEQLENSFMTLPYECRILRKKVYIKDDPTDPTQWETKTISPIQNVFRAVRRDIENSRSMQVNNKYVYLDDLCTDPTDPDHTEKIYHRLDKLTANLTAINMTTDIDGRPTPTLTTADPSMVESMENLLSLLNLTTRQATIFKYMTQGYGKKAIATRLGVNDKTVYEQIKSIRKKAIDVFTDHPDIINPHTLAKYIK